MAAKNVGYWIFAVFVLAGCQGLPDGMGWNAGMVGKAAPPTPTAGDAAFDPCAERLHDLCGQLLLYYARHEQLPQGLADLNKGTSQPSGPLGGEFAAEPLVCPASGKAYVYNRTGLEVSGRSGRLIVYDAAACHVGMRSGILMEPPQPGKSPVLKVIRPPESAIQWRETQKEPGTVAN
jgi:hypothetical protein